MGDGGALHPTHTLVTLDQLDPILVQPKRLAALGIIASLKKVEFTFIRDQLDVSDSDLSKQMRSLTDAGYVEARKTGKGKERTTWFAATDLGRQALENHAAALRAIIAPPPPTAAQQARAPK